MRCRSDCALILGLATLACAVPPSEDSTDVAPAQTAVVGSETVPTPPPPDAPRRRMVVAVGAMTSNEASVGTEGNQITLGLPRGAKAIVVAEPLGASGWISVAGADPVWLAALQA